MMKELNDEEWEAERSAATQYHFGIDAAEFVANFKSGKYDEDGCSVMSVLMLFPDLD